MRCGYLTGSGNWSVLRSRKSWQRYSLSKSRRLHQWRAKKSVRRFGLDPLLTGHLDEISFQARRSRGYRWTQPARSCLKFERCGVADYYARAFEPRVVPRILMKYSGRRLRPKERPG